VNFQRLWRIVRKEFIQIRRDPQTLRIILVMPVIQLFIYGYAVSTDVRHVATALLDEDRTAESRALAEKFVRSGYFDVRQRIDHEHQVDRVMDGGLVQAVIRVPRGFARDLAANRTARIQVILDGTDSMTSGVVSGYAAGVIREYSQSVAVERLDRMRARVPRLPSVRAETRVWYNPELTSVNYMVPGVLAMILMMVGMIMTSAAIVREREIGTLEQIIVTPITARELIIGKFIPFVVIGYVEVAIILVVARFWFGVPIAGSVPLLFLLSAAFMLPNLGLGLFISTVSRTQQQANMTMVFLMMPSILLSGFIFPVENMPDGIRWVSYCIPMHYYLVIVRGIFLKGNGLDVLWPPVAVLLGMGAVILGLSALRFRKNLG
jgi:ABC-2 type transport system permease protein